VNDGFGHAEGDSVLVRIASILLSHGFAGRLGGDEFALWVAGDASDGEREAESAVVEVNEAFSDSPYSVSISIGVAAFPEAGADAAALLRAADEALYAAKAAGSGYVRAADLA